MSRLDEELGAGKETVQTKDLIKKKELRKQT